MTIKKDRRVAPREVTVFCRCGNVDIVNEGSLCDLWHLCKECARKDIEAGRLNVSHVAR